MPLVNGNNVDALSTNWKQSPGNRNMTAMDKLRAIRLFVRVTNAGSFTAVADE